GGVRAARRPARLPGLPPPPLRRAPAAPRRNEREAGDARLVRGAASPARVAGGRRPGPGGAARGRRPRADQDPRGGRPGDAAGARRILRGAWRRTRCVYVRLVGLLAITHLAL